MRSLTAEMVIWQCRGSSSIVEVAASLAAFVGVLRGAEKGVRRRKIELPRGGCGRTDPFAARSSKGIGCAVGR
jgi:hypothetical protein